MRALIIDDEPMPAKLLQDLVRKHCFEIRETEVITVASHALEHLKTNSYDLIFLDVKMPEINGFQFLDHAQLSVDTAVIFTTAFADFAVDAFKVNATDYLMKPYQEDDLIRAVRKVSEKQRSLDKPDRKGTISIYDGEQYLIIKEEDIIRLEADGSYTKIITVSHGAQMASKRLGQFESQLNPDEFFRCHHSHMINLQQISKVSKGKSGYITLMNKEEVPVSQARKEVLHQLLHL